MTESPKKTTTASPKEKKSLLEDEIGSEFLNSWKSISVRDDMDFGFETVGKGKNKAFGFDKMDMDFNLGGDFEKLSSFNVDMPDLDFTCSPKKGAKEKDREKEEFPGVKKQGKKDCFSFSFDFNETRSFCFDSAMPKGGKSPKNTLENKGDCSEIIESQGSEVQKPEAGAAFDVAMNNKLPMSKSVNSPKKDILERSTKEFSPVRNGSTTNAVPQNPPVENDSRASFDETISLESQEINQHGCPLDKETTTETCNPLWDVKTSDVAPKVSKMIRSPAKNRSNLSNEEFVNEGKKEINEAAHVKENLLIEESSPHNSEVERNSKERNISDKGRSGSMRVTFKNIYNYLELADTANSSEFRKELHQDEDDEDNGKSKHEVPLARRSMENIAPPVYKESRQVSSNFSMKSEEIRYWPQSPSAKMEISSPGSKRLTSLHPNTMDENQPHHSPPSKLELSLHSDKKLACMHPSSMDAHHPYKPPALGTEINLPGSKELPSLQPNRLDDKRESNSASSAHPGSKLSGILKFLGKGQVENISTALGSQKNVAAADKTLVQVNTLGNAEKSDKLSMQTNTNHGVKSTKEARDPKMNNLDGNRLATVRSLRTSHDISSLSVRRPTGTSGDKLNSAHLHPSKAIRNHVQKMEEPEKSSSEMVNLPGKNRPLQSSSLKRKTYKDSQANSMLYSPSKRLAQSPGENRSFKELPQGVGATEVSAHANLDVNEIKHVSTNHSELQIPISPKLNAVEIGAPFLIENDENVEKAEAYTKDLENICNMLRKKQEEAKELLVRALVNNNKLLILNHPIYDEKIWRIKNFASKLMSKEGQI